MRQTRAKNQPRSVLGMDIPPARWPRRPPAPPSFAHCVKRGIYGVYHHLSQEHLKRYLCEFGFRYNSRVALGYTDTQRTEIAAAGIYGKRLTYRRIDERPNV